MSVWLYTEHTIINSQMEPKETNVLETYGDRIKDTCQKILVNFKESLKFLKFDNIDRRRMARKDRIDRQMEE